MNKILEMLSSLSRKEFQAFTLYMESPYFCQHQDTLDLFRHLRPHFPDFPSDLLDQFTSSSTGRAISRTRLNTLKSYLLEHVYRFLAHDELKQTPQLEKSLRVDRLRKMGRFNDAKKQLQSAISDLENAELIESAFFTTQIRLRELEIDLAISSDMRSGSLSFAKVFSALDQHYLAFGLKYLLPAFTLQRLFSHRFPTERWKRAQNLLEEFDSTPPVLISIFNHLLHLFLGGPEREHLPRLLELLDTHSENLSTLELINAFGNLQNYFTQRMLKGDRQALDKLFDTYKEMDRHGVIFGRGEFSGHLFRNIIVIGCRLHQIKWTSRFLEDNRESIQDQLGGSALAYGEAYLDFYRGNFSQSLAQLQQLSFVDPFYRTGHQVLMLRIFYELEDFESQDSLARTFRRYVNRTPAISENQKNQYRNFISILHQLAGAKENGSDSRRLQRIRELLAEDHEVSDRTWLNEKLAELETG